MTVNTSQGVLAENSGERTVNGGCGYKSFVDRKCRASPDEAHRSGGRITAINEKAHLR